MTHWIYILPRPCCMLNQSAYSNISTTHLAPPPFDAREAQTDNGTFTSSAAEYVTEMTRCWTTNMTFPMLEQNLTYLLQLGNAFIKSIMHDQNSRMLLITQQNYLHSLKSIWLWRWWNTKGLNSARGRYSWNMINTFLFRRNSSQEKTEELPNAHVKSMDVKYEDI
jgi:hypothetical protein